jgi:hypothetical protein
MQESHNGDLGQGILHAGGKFFVQPLYVVNKSQTLRQPALTELLTLIGIV